MVVKSLELLIYPKDKPKDYVDPNTGYRTRLYNIWVFSRSLGREPVTIRKWEISGTIPKTPFKDKKSGHVYYSEEQIRIVINCAERAKLCDGRKISDTSFTKWVTEQWNVLFDEIFRTGRKEEVSIEDEEEYYHRKVLERRKLNRKRKVK